MIAHNSLTWPYSAAEIKEDPYKRLRIGPSFPDLVHMCAALHPDRSVDEVRRGVSKLLDYLVDAGVVVPTIAAYEGEYFRIYRRGEAPPRDPLVDRIRLGMTEHGKPLSQTRIAKIAAILSFSESADTFTHVSSKARGNVVAFDADVLDDDAEVTQYMLRTGAIERHTT